LQWVVDRKRHNHGGCGRRGKRITNHGEKKYLQLLVLGLALAWLHQQPTYYLTSVVGVSHAIHYYEHQHGGVLAESLPLLVFELALAWLTNNLLIILLLLVMSPTLYPIMNTNNGGLCAATINN
jgi:hypothetical protein